jgi:Protein of unknown function (DUF2971)
MEPEIICKKCDNVFNRRMLECPKCGEIGVKALYKYVSFNEHSLSILINKSIWCPKAKSLNDPFEFYFCLNDNSIDKDSIKKTKNDIKEMAVICFSETNDDILMWTHYAQGHTGFCIEFDRTTNNELGDYDKCVPVIYGEDNQVLSFTSSQIEKEYTFTKIATSKSKHWEFENEWRLIIRREFANKYIPLPAQITSIIFGCEMLLENRRTIANILGPKYLYKEAIKSDKEFSLKIESVTFEDIMKIRE